ncbi:hypothetical protein SCCGRSA3_02055 [Marine Group I thaumarchaeote SCGC RSA3]|uniref:Uncharacterized protein n=3 Tax=Marine Group I TaxID=905826 RepID=A0A081RNY5_9ARCH|nr:hypothetical protein AAA799N04_00578 [Marine Group I thaumarchaeote SCGC AAA799-N04]KFM15669.1 hypothetical protein AAA799D11_01111 [Marine Group I thaumarchaeote SCGC AAA799-D11]KFM16806.1 hypothetical protein SCCGRSA3_02055 [Marine Group I thaumarchaeote SCGC RSA3]
MTKIKTNYAVYGTILGIMLLSTTIDSTTFQVFAQTTNEFTVRDSEQINKDPVAKSILEKIEHMKKRMVEIKEERKRQQEHQKFIEQQRELARQELNKELDRINDKYKDNTPKASFSSFVASKPAQTQSVYWDMFNFQQEKVADARKAMKNVLDNGGSLQEARNAYHEAAAVKRIQLIDITKNLNIKHGLAEDSVQSTFDKYGKLPRYD